MSRIIGEKTTQTYIIRKYISMQNWPKGLLYAPAAFFHRAREEHSSSEPLLLVKWFLSPFSRPPGNNFWDLVGTLGTLEDLQSACFCWERRLWPLVSSSSRRDCWGLSVCSAMVVTPCRARSPAPLGATAAPAAPATQHARDLGSAGLPREDAALQV